MPWRWKSALLGLLTGVCTVAAQSPNPLRPLVQGLMDQEAALADVPFAEVIHAATGQRVLPLDPAAEADRALLARLGRVFDRALAELRAPGHPAHQERRINEVSAHVEQALLRACQQDGAFDCDYPRTVAGKIQRSGYPDLRLVDRLTGRVLYLDPKVFAVGSRDSSLRTFYYEPKRDTNKVREDAHHLLLGLAHGGRLKDQWDLQGWELVDLARFRVRLKAEFQGSNRDLYRPGAVLSRSAVK